MLLINKRINVALISVLVLFVFSKSWASEQNAKRIIPITTWLLDSQTEMPPLSSGTFIEEDGLVVVEMESLDAPQGWTTKNDDNGAIGSYLEWTDRNSLQVPGNGLISVKVFISNPGTYQFIWRNSIRDGESTTDANDSFIRILSDNFQGFRARDESVVCPRQQPATNRCEGREPEGSSRDGWFKVYRSGGPAVAWLWSSFTSDSDAHSIYAEFDRVGEYEIQISARSMSHAIDRFVLFRSRNLENNITENFATNSARPESSRAP